MKILAASSCCAYSTVACQRNAASAKRESTREVAGGAGQETASSSPDCFTELQVNYGYPTF